MAVIVRSARGEQPSRKQASNRVNSRATRAMPFKPHRVTVGNAPVDRLSMREAVRWTMNRLRDRQGAGSPLLIMASNAQVVTLAEKCPGLARALEISSLNVPDGVSVVMASRLLGSPVTERVPGGELMERLCEQAAGSGLSVFFLGGLPNAAAGAAAKLTCRYPALKVAGWECPPLGFEHDVAESAAIRSRIADAAPDLLCVALGVPKQEIWMMENCLTLPIGAAIAVGAALDTCAGLRKRAPRWTHKVGLEWLYRLMMEPRRLGPRYLIGNALFVALVVRQVSGQKFAQFSALRSAVWRGGVRNDR